MVGAVSERVLSCVLFCMGNASYMKLFILCRAFFDFFDFFLIFFKFYFDTLNFVYFL